MDFFFQSRKHGKSEDIDQERGNQSGEAHAVEDNGQREGLERCMALAT
jgi:hypothetical protein